MIRLSVCIRHGERHVEDARQRLCEQRLAAAGRADQQDVRLGEFDIIMLGLMTEALVVVMDGDRQHPLGVVLADHVVVEDLSGPWASGCPRATSPARTYYPPE